MIYLSTYPSICFIFRHRFILFGLRLTCQASLFNLVMINFDIEQQSRCDWIYVCGCFARTCLSNGLLASLGGGGGTKVGVERRKSYYNLCPVLSDSEPFLWYIIAPESSILVFLVLMSLIESDYDLVRFWWFMIFMILYDFDLTESWVWNLLMLWF